MANSVQRSYALEWEARIDHPCVPARTLSQAVTPLFSLFVSIVVFMILPPNLLLPSSCAALPLPLPLPLLPLDTTQTLLGMTIGVPKMMIFLSASKAMKDFDPAGATSPPKWSAQSPRSALVGLNFSTYNGGLHHNLHLGLLP